MRNNQGLKGRKETPRVKEIFRLYVEDQLSVTEIAKKLDTSHQAISAVITDDFFKELETHYFEAMERELSLKQRKRLMETRSLLYDHATEAARCLIEAAQDKRPAVRGAAVKAQEAILKQIGLGRDNEDISGSNMLVIKFDSEVVSELQEGGYSVPPSIEIKNPTHASYLGKTMGEGVREAKDKEQSNGS